MTGCVYVWKSPDVIVVAPPEGESRVYWNNFPEELLNLPCVDTAFPDSNRSARYGEFYYASEENSGWEPLPFSEFPAEFKAHLLLLGVS